MQETRHPSHGDMLRDGVLRLAHAAGSSYGELAGKAGVSRETIRHRIERAKGRGYDYVRTGCSLTLRNVNYLVATCPRGDAWRIVDLPDGLRVLDLDPHGIKVIISRRPQPRRAYADHGLVLVWCELMLNGNNAS